MWPPPNSTLPLGSGLFGIKTGVTMHRSWRMSRGKRLDWLEQISIDLSLDTLAQHLMQKRVENRGDDAAHRRPCSIGVGWAAATAP
ncbi:hypothetical protein [Modicisalibacter luteus]|uniref:hypothetical protein n=1 Tax=Modicisalibacter luteus TaxID=453962 RepID=UPI00362A4E33